MIIVKLKHTIFFCFLNLASTVFLLELMIVCLLIMNMDYLLCFFNSKVLFFKLSFYFVFKLYFLTIILVVFYFSWVRLIILFAIFSSSFIASAIFFNCKFLVNKHAWSILVSCGVHWKTKIGLMPSHLKFYIFFLHRI